MNEVIETRKTPPWIMLCGPMCWLMFWAWIGEFPGWRDSLTVLMAGPLLYFSLFALDKSKQRTGNDYRGWLWRMLASFVCWAVLWATSGERPSWVLTLGLLSRSGCRLSTSKYARPAIVRVDDSWR